jgi:hypothetical protein
MGVMATQNDSKLHVMYDLYIIYTTIIYFNYWNKIKVIIN